MPSVARFAFRLARRSSEPSLKGMEVLSALLSFGRVLECHPDILESTPESTDLNYSVSLEAHSDSAVSDAEAFLKSDRDLLNVAVTPVSPDDLRPTSHREAPVQVSRLLDIERQAAELVAAGSRLGRMLERLDADCAHGETQGLARGIKEACQAHQAVAPLLAQVRDTARRMLLVPASTVLARLHRPVRDLARELGKEVHFSIVGDDTELEQSALEELREPLLHLVRNAVGHGIEPPAEREMAGKPAAGSIQISVYVAGDNFVLELRDDGRGLDPERIGQRALQMGLIDRQTLETATPRELFGFIYQPGFSTADALTTVSGRGFGLDIVKGRIAELHGTIETDSRLGSGVTFTLRVPLSASLVRALMVQAAGHRVALPASAIRSVAIAQDWDSAHSRAVPVGGVAKALGWGDAPSSHIVEVGVAERRIGLGVESCLDWVELAVRPMGSFLGRLPGVLGAGILSDGQPVLVLDVSFLAERVGGTR